MGGRRQLAEEVTRLELAALDELARRVGRGEHEVGLHRDLVQLGHGVAQEVLGDRRGDGVELLGADPVVVVGGPVPLRQRRGGQPVLGHQPGDGLHVGHPGLAAAQAEGHEPVEAGPDLTGDPHARPRALALLPVFGDRPTWPMDAIITASWAETSTTWGRPEANALGRPPRPRGPTCDQAVGSVQRTGARSGSPVQYMFPVEAITPRSLARHRHRGPSAPNGVTWTQTAPGARAGSTSRAPGQPGVSSTMSAPAEQLVQAGVVGPVHLDQGLARVPGHEAQRRAVGGEGRHPAQGVAARAARP